MTALTWAVRLIIFFFLVVFAIRNTDPITLNLIFDRIEEVPLVIVLLTFFAAGAVLGALSLLGALYRQRREISRLRQQLSSKAQQESVPEQPPAP